MFLIKSVGNTYKKNALRGLLCGGIALLAAATCQLPRAVQAEAPAPAAIPEAPAVSALPGKGLVVTSADGRFQVGVRARIQLRDAYQRSAEGKDTNDVNVKTVRLFVQGHVLTTDLKYTVQLAFGSGDYDKDTASPLFDAYIDYTRLRDLNVRVGQYLVPFDRARTIREFALQFVDRQTVVRELTLDRDVGLMFSSTDLGGMGNKLAYNVFLGAGDGKNRVADGNNRYGSQAPSLLSVARLVVRPMGAFDDDQEGDLTRKKTPRLALGIAGGYSVSASRQRVTSGDTYTLGTFNYAHGAVDAVFKYAGFSLLAETVLRDANRRQHQGKNAAGAAVVERSQSGFGYFTQIGQMLTEKLEATARWDDLHARKKTDPKFVDLVNTRGRQFGAGMNYYFKGHAFKVQSDYFFIFGSDSGRGAHAARVQLDATF